MQPLSYSTTARAHGREQITDSYAYSTQLRKHLPFLCPSLLSASCFRLNLQLSVKTASKQQLKSKTHALNSPKTSKKRKRTVEQVAQPEREATASTAPVRHDMRQSNHTKLNTTLDNEIYARR
jgi:hypothetical protein